MIVNPYSFAPPVYLPNPLAWWKFDDGAYNNSVDSSGNGYTLSNTYGTWGSGHIGGSLGFSASSNDICRVLPGPIQARPFTVAGWINASSDGVIWSILDSGSNNWSGWYGEHASGLFKVNAADNNSFGTAATKAGAASTFVHYAATIDNSGNGQVYINGVAGSSQAFGVNPGSLTYGFSIGASAQNSGLNTTGSYVTMSADDWRIYSSVLSGPQIVALASM